ncbi:MAG: hypothetical protein H0W44_09490 [Gammaproteobacteria bacterium]|nr:hypothetical protein [Gammaproteobacteria bacterium]
MTTSPTPPAFTVRVRLQQLGFLRLALLAMCWSTSLAAVYTAVFRPAEGWGFALGIFVPAIAPVLFMVVMLDVLMCQVFKAEAAAEIQAKMQWMTWVNFVSAMVLLLTWLPLFIRATRV